MWQLKSDRTCYRYTRNNNNFICICIAPFQIELRNVVWALRREKDSRRCKWIFLTHFYPNKCSAVKWFFLKYTIYDAVKKNKTNCVQRKRKKQNFIYTIYNSKSNEETFLFWCLKSQIPRSHICWLIFVQTFVYSSCWSPQGGSTATHFKVGEKACRKNRLQFIFLDLSTVIICLTLVDLLITEEKPKAFPFCFSQFSSLR